MIRCPLKPLHANVQRGLRFFMLTKRNFQIVLLDSLGEVFSFKTLNSISVLLPCHSSHNKKNDNHTDTQKTNGKSGDLSQKTKSSKPDHYPIVILIIEADQFIHDNPPPYLPACSRVYLTLPIMAGSRFREIYPSFR